MATIFMTPGNDYDANEIESERADVQRELEEEYEAEQARLNQIDREVYAEFLKAQA